MLNPNRSMHSCVEHRPLRVDVAIEAGRSEPSSPMSDSPIEEYVHFFLLDDASDHRIKISADIPL